MTQRIRRRRFVLEKYSINQKIGIIYTLLRRRFWLQKSRANDYWTATDIFGVFEDINGTSLHALKRKVIRRYLDHEARIKAEKRRKRGLLSFQEKIKASRRRKFRKDNDEAETETVRNVTNIF